MIEFSRFSLADVGDALCSTYEATNGIKVMIDWGGDTDIKAMCGAFKIQAFNSHKFILSHFHLDHYYGLVVSSKLLNARFMHLDDVYFPKLPDLIYQRKNLKTELLKALLCINSRIFGGASGVQEYDFLYTLTKINATRFHYHPVSCGEIIPVGTSNLVVLWPPKAITDPNTLRKVNKAIQIFEKAKETDSQTRELYDKIVVNANQYFEEGFLEPREERPDISTAPEGQNLPDIVRQANNSLRSVANDICLVFFVKDDLLFLGDIGGNIIRKVIPYLVKKKSTNFRILISAHHGTKWHNSLYCVSSCYCLTSNGRNLANKFKEEYKRISKICYTTFADGDILV